VRYVSQRLGNRLPWRALGRGESLTNRGVKPCEVFANFVSDGLEDARVFQWMSER
jgi:hypothetical protein